MLSKLETYLNEKNVFNYKEPKIVTNLINTIPSNIPYKMKAILVISEIITYISQFRINIKHWNNSSIPINAITFLIAESGASKDSTLKNIRKSFQSSYDLINKKRREIAINNAINKAKELNLENPTNYHVYSEFYTAPNPLFVAPSTTEGFIQHLNDIDNIGIGAGYLSTSELGAELSNNAYLVDNIKLISELYDEGIKDVKVLKDRNNQSKEIRGLPVSALFMGSQGNILYDENTKRKFKVEFDTKLSRRSLFVYIDEKIVKDTYNNINELLNVKKYIENSSLTLQQDLSEALLSLTDILLERKNTHITISEEVRDLIIIYKEYNELLAETIDNLSSMTKLTRQHMHWKALKLAGALALIKNRNEIDIDSYSYAITFVESIFKDISIFEQELNKEAYEVFVSYVHNYNINNKLYLSLHDLKKKKFISSKGDLNKKLEELVTLSSIYDKNGIYKKTNDGIEFEKLQTSNNIGVSLLLLDGDKEYRVKNCDKGYIYEETTFDKLTSMLKKDFVYTPFKFQNGIRGKDNIISGIKWIALDVDNSEFTDEETHLLLEDLKHIIVRTSDVNNPYKFRVLLEFDNIVNIPNIYWRRFLESIQNTLAINIDLLPQSQIFFSYKNSYSSIITNLDGDLFTVKPHIEYALNKELKLTEFTDKNDLDSPLETFRYAYEAKQGEGSRAMIRAAKHAKSLGANKEQIIKLMYDINNYWIKPMNDIRFDNTIIKQIESWSI